MVCVSRWSKGAMLQMRKFDVAGLEAAYASALPLLKVLAMNVNIMLEPFFVHTANTAKVQGE